MQGSACNPLYISLRVDSMWLMNEVMKIVGLWRARLEILVTDRLVQIDSSVGFAWLWQSTKYNGPGAMMAQQTVADLAEFRNASKSELSI